MAKGFEINFKFDVKEVTRYLNGVQKKAVPKAEVMALNRVGKTSFGVAVKEIAQTIGFTSKKVRERMFVTKANRNRRVVVIDGRKARAINMIEYVKPQFRNPQYFRQQYKRKRTEDGKPVFKFKGVKVKVGNRKMTTIEGAFIGKGKRSGKMLVYLRRTKGNNRSKAMAVPGPSPQLVFRSDKVQKLLQKTARGRWSIEFTSALKNELRKLG